MIGARVATLPISAGPSYVFLALDHNAAFIAEGALASLPVNAVTIILGLIYVLLAQRHNALVSWSGWRRGMGRACRFVANHSLDAARRSRPLTPSCSEMHPATGLRLIGM